MTACLGCLSIRISNRIVFALQNVIETAALSGPAAKPVAIVDTLQCRNDQWPLEHCHLQ
jgi:hypothetical protein